LQENGFLALEIGGVLANLIFVIGVVRQQIWAWPFGIAGSILGAIYFGLISPPLLAEAGLYIFYAWMGWMGWRTWKRNSGHLGKVNIVRVEPTKHVAIVFIGLIAWLTLGYSLKKFTSSDLPYLDSFSTVFSIIATFLEIRRWLHVWAYWIILNGFSIYLYFLKDSFWYSMLMVIFTILSIWGYRSWWREYSNHRQNEFQPT
jgi:nicotinamide mononucleotide transporter